LNYVYGLLVETNMTYLNKSLHYVIQEYVC